MLNSYSVQIKYRPNQKDQGRSYTTYKADIKKAFNLLETVSCEETSPFLNLKTLSFI